MIPTPPTPAPWGIHPDEDTNSSAELKVAPVAGESVPGNYYDPAIGRVHNNPYYSHTDGRADANSQLIRMAPELLDALKQVLFGRIEPKAIRQLIAQAYGQESFQTWMTLPGPELETVWQNLQEAERATQSGD
ncbi:hypothetical protein [Endozoicomonas lisbonensis]|uniref:Catalase immune-responsive domain-containing protein n=1 Tax=Endozoicomonas lisbonensis TaxID=3120522 RepID=A0ABV2SQI1_9GAMM